VELRETGLTFAMKAMDKQVMMQRNKVHRARAERDILSLLDHPFLPTLYSTFQVSHLSAIRNHAQIDAFKVTRSVQIMHPN